MSTRNIILTICEILSDNIGNDLINFEFFITIFSSSLVKVVFPILCKEITFNLDQDHKNYVINLLVQFSNISKDTLLSKFDLSDANLMALIEILGIYKQEENRYAFYINRNASLNTITTRAIPEKFIQYFSPVKDNKAHIFEKIDTGLSRSQVYDFLKQKNSKSVFIYDPDINSLFELKIAKFYCNYNDILYEKLTSRINRYIPYDPQTHHVRPKDLYIKDKDNNYYPLNLKSNVRPSIRTIGLNCSNNTSIIITYADRNPYYISLGDARSSLQNFPKLPICTVEILDVKPVSQSRFL